MTRVLITGSGGREHALAWTCSRSPRCEVVFCAPGNGGTSEVAQNLPIAADDAAGIAAAARQHAIDLVVLGPDASVAAGVADACAEAGIPVFGPTAAAGRIETSKRFAKVVMDRAGIPTARWRAGEVGDRDSLVDFARELRGLCVVKADGLALGKGVTVCGDLGEATTAIDACLVRKRFGEAGLTVVVEERLTGSEVSILALSDGVNVRLLGAACDYKRAYDGDRGPNTGGMGSYTPPSRVDSGHLLDEVARDIAGRCVEALRELGHRFVGCLFPGLILTSAGWRVLEFNARFGDPETQVLLPAMAEDVVDLLCSAAAGGLAPGTVQIDTGARVGVVAASGGYPGAVEIGSVISGIDRLDDDVVCFHSGTTRAADGTLRTSGGRVLTVVARGQRYALARDRAYANLRRISFEGMRYRSDIAEDVAARS